MPPHEWVQKRLVEMEEAKQDDEVEALAIDKSEIYSICVAFGGPSMFWDIEVRDGEVIGGTWRYAWWGNPESVNLTEREAQMVADYFMLEI